MLHYTYSEEPTPQLFGTIADHLMGDGVNRAMDHIERGPKASTLPQLTDVQCADTAVHFWGLAEAVRFESPGFS